MSGGVSPGPADDLAEAEQYVRSEALRRGWRTVAAAHSEALSVVLAEFDRRAREIERLAAAVSSESSAKVSGFLTADVWKSRHDAVVAAVRALADDLDPPKCSEHGSESIHVRGPGCVVCADHWSATFTDRQAGRGLRAVLDGSPSTLAKPTDLRRSQTPPKVAEPGYQRIADAITNACEAADIDLTVVHDGRVLDYVPGVRWLATVLDKAGLIDWTAFGDGSTDTPREEGGSGAVSTRTPDPRAVDLCRCPEPPTEQGSAEAPAPAPTGDAASPHLVDAAAPAVRTLLARVADGMWSAEDARDVLLDWPNRAAGNVSTAPDPAALTVAARAVLDEWARMHPSGHLAMYPAMDALRAALRTEEARDA